MYNSELLTIAEAFKIWQYYLKTYKLKNFIVINYNNFHHFMNAKSLNS